MKTDWHFSPSPAVSSWARSSACPKGSVTVRIESSQPIEEAILGDVQAELTAPRPPAETHRALLKVPSQGDPLFLSITCRTAANGRPFSLRASYRIGDEEDRSCARA